MLLNAKILKEIRTAPELEAVQIIEEDQERITLLFEPGTTRTGKELLKVQDILFKNEIYNFIKNEKVLLFENIIKEIQITIY